MTAAYYSHRGVLLKEHLERVGKLSREYASPAAKDARIVELAEIVGRSHDVAKYTHYFQAHLRGIKVGGDLYRHSYLSSILASWVIAQRLKDPLLAAIGFLCVHSHHGNLMSFSRLRDKAGNLRYAVRNQTLLKQIGSIKENLAEISGELEEVGLPEVADFVRDAGSHLGDLSSSLEEALIELLVGDSSKRWQAYYNTLLVFSALVDADKKDAGGVRRTGCAKALPPSAVTEYIEKRLAHRDPSGMGALRRSLFLEASERLEEVLRGDVPSVITITAPTGSGKTLLGLYVALRLAEHLKRARVIYSLPYINIIEQTHSVFEDVLATYYGERSDVSVLLKHHHLAFPAPEGVREDVSLDELLLLVDAWDSRLVITTFEQLLRSIIGSRNSLLKKFHNIAGSILILDEVQAIPLEYWRLVRDALLRLAEHFDVRIVLMTATMPAIFRRDASSGGRGVAELVADREKYFKRLSRVAIYPHLDRGMGVEEFVDFFLSRWKEGSSALVVLNTVRTSKKVYRRLVEKLGDRAVRIGWSPEGEVSGSPRTVLAYLSTSVLPLERKRRIELLRKLLKEGRSAVLVSTQVVEAGVDLDFDVVFRDLGPLDSVVQVAGRCNRNGRLPEGEVYVVRIIDEEGREDSSKIYGRILPRRTAELLRGREVVKEPELAELVERYYEDISYRMNAEESEESRELLERIEGLDFEGLAGFSLIEEEPKVTVYVEYDKRASELLKEAVELRRELSGEGDLEEVFRLKAELRRLRAEMENYVVEVYKSEESLRSLEPHPHLGVLHVPSSVVHVFYDPETGFRDSRDGEAETVVF